MNTITFNDFSLNEIEGAYIISVSSSLLPNKEVKAIEREKGVGSKYIRTRLKERYHIVEMEILDKNNADMRALFDNLSSKLYTEEEKELIVNGRKYKASLEGTTDIDYLIGTRKIKLTFLSTNPIGYTEAETMLIIWDFNKTIGGNYKTLPSFRIEVKEPTDFIEITNRETGDSVYIEHNFIAGDEVVVDFAGKWKARKNGYVIAEDIYLTSRFFYLEPGLVSLRLSPSSLWGYMTYTKRWL